MPRGRAHGQVGVVSTLTYSSFPANQHETVARCVEEVMPRGGVLTAAREEEVFKMIVRDDSHARGSVARLLIYVF